MDHELVNLTGAVLQSPITGELQRFFVIWRDGQQHEVLEALNRWANDPDLLFSKADAIDVAIRLCMDEIDYELEAAFAERRRLMRHKY